MTEFLDRELTKFEPNAEKMLNSKWKYSVYPTIGGWRITNGESEVTIHLQSTPAYSWHMLLVNNVIAGGITYEHRIWDARPNSPEGGTEGLRQHINDWLTKRFP